MARTPNASKQTALLLSALLERRTDWMHGYGLSQLTELKSGTLYPLLIRLEGQGFVESRWLESEKPGRPPRHVYRLTRSGQALARERRSEMLSGQQPRRLRSTV